MEEQWIHFQNPFYNGTKDNLSLFNDVSIIHNDRLKADQGDAFVKTLYDAYEPYYTTFSESYSHWKQANNQQGGNTREVNQLLDLLASEKIRKWDVTIQGLYDVNSPQYKRLLPQRRKPFQRGAKEATVGAVGVLAKGMEGDAKLVDLQKEIAIFYKELVAASEVRIGEKPSSVPVELAQRQACTVMFANLGKCIGRFADNPELAAKYFAIELIRRKIQDTFKGKVKPMAIRNVAKRTLAPTDLVSISNDGELAFTVMAAPTNKSVAGAPAPIVVNGGETKFVTAAELGNDKANPFIMIANDDKAHTAMFTITIS